MKDDGRDKAGTDTGPVGRQPALQIICLGSGGGPCEDNVTGFLVRSTGSDWVRNSLLAVDAGSHLAPITKILERDFPAISGDDHKETERHRMLNGGASDSEGDHAVDDAELRKPSFTILDSGPFAGLKFPNASARANALHVLRTFISAYLITHPHLDHLSGFAINTAAFHATSRPKTVAALPSTVDAMKRHIFNDVIWPNLTDEDGGVGFVTFQRLKEGGDPMVGEGDGRGYIDVCDGLGVRAFKVSHGVCTKSPPSHHHRGSIAGLVDSQPQYNGSAQGSAQDLPAAAMNRSMSISHQFSAPGTPGGSRQSFLANHSSPHLAPPDNVCVVDSTAFFIRDFDTSREILFFGDVEPDSLSLTPRNQVVWTEAAHKVACGLLGAIFIECSYDDSQADAFLFGHLNPRHLIAELQVLAALTEEAKIARATEKKEFRKRKSSSLSGLLLPEHDRKRTRSLANGNLAPQEPHRDSRSSDQSMPDAPVQASAVSSGKDSSSHVESQLDESRTVPLSPKALSIRRQENQDEKPLDGIKIVIIHIKDTFRDGPHIGNNIVSQLRDYEQRLQEQGQGLGCEFVVSQSGESYWI